MFTTQKWLSITLAVIFASGSVGCGAGFKTFSKSSSSAQSAASTEADSQAAVQKAADATVAAQAAMADANAAIAQLTDANGNINTGLFKATSTAQTATQGLLQPLVDKLNAVFDKVFAQVDVVKSRIANARAVLADALAKLSVADPAQAAQITMLKDQLAKVDALELQFQTMVHGLASKLDLATTAIDKLISTASSSIPIPGLGSVAGALIDTFVMSDVKELINTLKTKLLGV